MVYDPSVKTLLADKGEIRVGPKYQADIPDMLPEGACFGFTSWEMVSYNMKVLVLGEEVQWRVQQFEPSNFRNIASIKE